MAKKKKAPKPFTAPPRLPAVAPSRHPVAPPEPISTWPLPVPHPLALANPDIANPVATGLQLAIDELPDLEHNLPTFRDADHKLLAQEPSVKQSFFVDGGERVRGAHELMVGVAEGREIVF